jgi:hypothetical protein
MTNAPVCLIPTRPLQQRGQSRQVHGSDRGLPVSDAGPPHRRECRDD